MSWLFDALMLSSPWELLAVLLAIAYVVLAIRQSVWCWFAAALSASIYTLLFIDGRLYMESMLQVFYVVMAGYGYLKWRRSRGGNGELAVGQLGLGWHLRWIAVVTAVSLTMAWLMAILTSAESVYLDTFTTIFSLFATYLVARKILENWLYWIVIDLLYVFLFWGKGFYATAILFAIYTVMAAIGYWRWKRDMTPAGDQIA